MIALKITVEIKSLFTASEIKAYNLLKQSSNFYLLKNIVINFWTYSYLIRDKCNIL